MKKNKYAGTQRTLDFFLCLQRFGKFISPRTKIVANPGKKPCKMLSFIIFILGSVTYKTPVMLPTKVSAVLFIQPSSPGNKMLVDPPTAPRRADFAHWETHHFFT